MDRQYKLKALRDVSGGPSHVPGSEFIVHSLQLTVLSPRGASSASVASIASKNGGVGGYLFSSEAGKELRMEAPFSPSTFQRRQCGCPCGHVGPSRKLDWQFTLHSSQSTVDDCPFRPSASIASIASKWGGGGYLFSPETGKGASDGSSFPALVCSRGACEAVIAVTSGPAGSRSPMYVWIAAACLSVAALTAPCSRAPASLPPHPR